jgi:hypothetical protein
VELYLHSSICLHGVVLRKARGATLPLYFIRGTQLKLRIVMRLESCYFPWKLNILNILCHMFTKPRIVLR